MQYLFATFTVSDRLLHALSWTLLHSFWQGALIALLAGILFYGFAHLSASIRYKLLLGLMVFFLGMVGISFWIEWDKADTKSHTLVYLTNELAPKEEFKGRTSDSISSLYFEKKQDWVQSFERHKVLLILIWALVLALKSIKMCFDLAYTYKIRVRKTSPMAPVWSTRLQRLALQLGIKHKIHLLESGILQGPATLGVLKPLILLPVGLVSHLSVAQVEAILLHELAHIRRNDYLVNLLQCLLENVFFFNPALLWLSHLIREERENCCDDLAVQVLQDKQLYAQTLLSFQEFQWQEFQYAQAFGGNKTPLLTRIKRILKRRNDQTLHVYEKATLIFAFLAAGAFLIWAKPGLSNAPNFAVQTKKLHSTPSPKVLPAQKTPVLNTDLALLSNKAQPNLNFDEQPTPQEIADPPVSTVQNRVIDSLPVVDAELAKLKADLAFTTQQYEREKNRYDSIKAIVENTEERVVSRGTYGSGSQERVIRLIGTDLIADGIIKDAPALRTFRLDETTFKVNGRKLPKELIEKYQQRYLKKPLRGNYLRIMKVNQRVIVQRIDTAQTNQ